MTNVKDRKPKTGAERMVAYRNRLKRGRCIVPVETDRGSAERHSATIGMQGLITVPIVGEFGLLGRGYPRGASILGQDRSGPPFAPRPKN